MRKLIKVDGTESEFPSKRSFREIGRIIGAGVFDTVTLADRKHVMIVDDTGVIDGKPRNDRATALYHAVCRPGTAHYIAGDVFVCPDDDFA